MRAYEFRPGILLFMQNLSARRVASLSEQHGDAETGSDIDVLVVLQGPVSPGAESARISDIITSLSHAWRGTLSRICFVRSVRA